MASDNPLTQGKTWFYESFLPYMQGKSTTDVYIQEITKKYGNHAAQYLSETLFLCLTRRCFDIADELASNGVSIEYDNDDESPIILLLASSGHRPDAEAIKWLLDHGYDPSCRYVGLYHPIHLCAMYGYLEIAKLLHNRGVDLNMICHDDIDKTPLMIASKSGQEEVANWLISMGAK